MTAVLQLQCNSDRQSHARISAVVKVVAVVITNVKVIGVVPVCCPGLRPRIHEHERKTAIREARIPHVDRGEAVHPEPVLTSEIETEAVLRNVVPTIASTLCPCAMIAFPPLSTILLPCAMPLPPALLLPSSLLLPRDCLLPRTLRLLLLPGLLLLRPLLLSLLGTLLQRLLGSLLLGLLFCLLDTLLLRLLLRSLLSLLRVWLLSLTRLGPLRLRLLLPGLLGPLRL
jgi:hypothetical protein